MSTTRSGRTYNAASILNVAVTSNDSFESVTSGHKTPEMALDSVVVQVPQDPPRFTGRTSSSRAAQWLRDFEPTATFNGYSDDRKLAGVRFALQDIAAAWFDTAEQLETWDTFRTAFRARFMNTAAANEQALRELHKAYQDVGTPCLQHLETILRWCQELTPAIEEPEQIRWYARSASLSYRAALVANLPKTLTQLREMLMNFDLLLTHGNTPPPGENEYQVRNITKHEREYSPRQLTHRDDRPRTPSLTRSRERSLSPPRSRHDDRSPSRLRSSPTRRPQPDGPYLKGSRFTEDGSPYCNWCGYPGHVLDECRNRRRGKPANQESPPASWHPPPRGHRPNRDQRPGNEASRWC